MSQISAMRQAGRNLAAGQKEAAARAHVEKFKDMHDVVRQRAIDDVDAMEKALAALRESRNQGDYRGDGHAQLNEELDKLEAHVATRKKNLA